jgi:hypothetical protein
MNGREWYYVKEGQQCGPVSEAGLIELIHQGTLGPATLVWAQGMEDWHEASTINALAPALYPPLHPERPAPVTVFGILNIVFGSLGLLCMPLGLIAIFAVPNAMNTTVTVKAWMLLSGVVGLACTIFLIVVGIGLLYLKAWARMGSLLYGWFAIIWGIIGTVVNFGVIPLGGYGFSHDAVPGVIGGILGGLIGLVYPILLVIFMRRPNVRSACTR